MIIIFEYDVVYLILRRSGPGLFLISQYLLQDMDIPSYHPISLLTRILLFSKWNPIVLRRFSWPSRSHKLFSILFHCIYFMDFYELIKVRYKFWKVFYPLFKSFLPPSTHSLLKTQPHQYNLWVKIWNLGPWWRYTFPTSLWYKDQGRG